MTEVNHVSLTMIATDQGLTSFPSGPTVQWRLPSDSYCPVQTPNSSPTYSHKPSFVVIISLTRPWGLPPAPSFGNPPSSRLPFLQGRMTTDAKHRRRWSTPPMSARHRRRAFDTADSRLALNDANASPFERFPDMTTTM
jgi:hypothetical protein